MLCVLANYIVSRWVFEFALTEAVLQWEITTKLQLLFPVLLQAGTIEILACSKVCLVKVSAWLCLPAVLQLMIAGQAV